jgi:PAS domain S-box-containing protein
MKRSDHGRNRTGIVFLLIFLGLAAGILAGGYFAYQNYKQNFRAEAERQLSAIAELKVSQLVQYRTERLGDASTFFKNPAFSNLVKQFFEQKNDGKAQRQLQTWLTRLQSSYSYEGLVLLDTRGIVRMSVPEKTVPIASTTRNNIPEVLRSRMVTMRDFHRNEHDQKIRLTILVPIMDDAHADRQIGVLLLRIDPEVYLYPFIQTWPVPSRTSETLIVRREGNDVLFLNELRFQKNTALNLRIPLSNDTVTAVKAVLGQKGIVDALDYRGEPVIADVRKVPDSPWFLVCRMDKAEIYEPLRSRLWLMIVLVGALITATGGGVGFVWRHQRNRFYVEQYKSAEALRESEALLQSIIDNSTSLIYIVDTEGKFLLANRALTLLLSVSRGALVGNTREVVMPKEIADLHRKNDLEVLDSGRTSVLEEENLEQDGKHTYLSVKYPLFNSAGKIYAIGGMSTDITARKRAEDNLRATNEYLEKLINHANAPIIVWDTTLVITRFNHAFEQLSGYKEEEVKGKSIDVLFSEGNTEHSLDLIRRAVGGERWETVEIEIQRKDGDPRIVLWNSANILGNDGKTVLATIAQGQDITARKQAENALRDSEVRFRQTFALSPVGIVRVGLDKRFHDCNSAFSQFLGYSVEELIGKSIEEVTFVEDRNLGMAEMGALVKGETQNPHVQKRYLRKDGQLVWGEVTISLIRDQEEQAQYFLSIIQDITDRKRNEAEFQRHYDISERSRIDLLSILEDQKRAEEALRTSEINARHQAEELARIMDVAPIAIWVAHDPLCHQITGNRTANAFYESEQGENVSAGPAADEHDTTRRFFESGRELTPDELPMQVAAAKGKEIRNSELEVLSPSGRSFTMLGNASPLRDDDGQVRGCVGSFVDITERKHAEKEVQMLNAELEQRVSERTAQLENANKELEAFSYSVSHDLRAPLRAVDGFSRIVLEEYAQKLDPEAGRLLQVIISSTQKMDELITDMLDLSRVSRNEMNVSRVAMAMLANSIYHESASPELRETFSFSVAPIPDAYCDPILIRQVWRNLISNAIKFTAPKDVRNIEIGSRTEDGMNVYFIRDSGVGYDPRYAHKLFGVFQRLHKTEDFEGTGVGLAIVQRIIHRHGGKVWAEGKVGEGATFWFSLPKRQEEIVNRQ